MTPEGDRCRLPFDIDVWALLPALVCWDEISQWIDPELPKIDGLNWYAPVSTARMIRSYFVRQWAGADTCLGGEAPATDQFDYFFEHYQLREIALQQIQQ